MMNTATTTKRLFNRKAAMLPTARGGHGQKGFTLTEVSVASGIAAMVALGMMSLLIMSSRMDNSIFYQQLYSQASKAAIESLNNEVRLATSSIALGSGSGGTNNRVIFTQSGGNTCIFELNPGADGNMSTQRDNLLRLSKNNGNSWTIIARHVTPADGQGGFGSVASNNVLTANMRFGDVIPATASARPRNGVQGVTINITVSPRLLAS